MRVYKKRTNRPAIPEEVLKNAVKLVLTNPDNKAFSVRNVAKSYKMNYATLGRYVKKFQQTASASDEIDSEDSIDDLSLERIKIPSGQVISLEHETAFISYITRCSQINCGLRPKHTREMVFQYANKYGIRYPKSWDKNKRAGEDWLTSFLKKHKDRLPFWSYKVHSRSATASKREVAKFYTNLKELINKHHLTEHSIYSLGDTGITTAVAPDKVATKIESKRTETTGGESTKKTGETLTILTAASAAGKVVPPMLILPRTKYTLSFLKNAPQGSVGMANGTGLISIETLVSFVKHFVKYTKPSENNPVLLILDSINAAYLSITLVDLCDKEGVELLVMPPHCALKLHPLEATLTGPFQKACNFSINEWLRKYSEEKMTIYDLPGIMREPFLTTMTFMKIKSEFSRTGIWPYNPQKFEAEDPELHFLAGLEMKEDDDFLPAVKQERFDYFAEPDIKHEPLDFVEEPPEVKKEPIDFLAETQVKQEEIDLDEQDSSASMTIDYSNFGYFT